MSRVYRIGTIYSRVDGLIRKGLLKESDKPLWFDIYRRFPPKYEPKLLRKAPEVEVREIFYKEDRLRARIHKEFEEELRIFNLNSNVDSHSQRLISACQKLISSGMSEDDAITQLKNTPLAI